MGLVASQARLELLTARKSDIEFAVQRINQERMRRAFECGVMAFGWTNMIDINNLNDDGYNYNEGALAAYQQADKIYEMQLKNLDTQHSAIEAELEAVKKVIDKNIEKSFKTFA